MLYRSENGRYPSLVVGDGKTVTLSGQRGLVSGVPALALRPKSTAALLLIAGRRPSVTPRLSDPRQFEKLDSTDGLVNLADIDEGRRVAGYSLPFLRGVLDALDPDERVPADRVRKLIPPIDTPGPCKCRGGVPSGVAARAATPPDDVSSLTDTAARKAGFSVRETFVPEFLIKFELYSLITRLGDIIVGRRATLILDSDVTFAIADNFLAYHGARIVQRGANLVLDVIGTMRGSLNITFHDIVKDRVKLDPKILAADLPTKP